MMVEAHHLGASAPVLVPEERAPDVEVERGHD